MAAKLSDLEDEMSGVNLQIEGHADMPPQSVKDLWELEASDQFSLPLTIFVPGQEATIQSP